MANVGYIALAVALATSIYSAAAYIFGLKRKYPAFVKSARISLFATCGLVSASVLVLLLALLTHNFQLEYVTSYSSRDLAWPYLVSALWAGNSGSLLFWAWLLTIFAAILAFQRRERSGEQVPYASSLVMLTEAFFLLVLVSVANPFQVLPVAPSDGTGLNPLLENPGMIFHPPALLIGYIGFTIPFALALGTLLSKKFNDEWLIDARKWTLIAWLFLGVGNIIGAWWAYVELGWGGYWAWDPVENAGLMPWLVATAFLHSIMVQRRRGTLKVWNIVLIIITFNLSIFGTFLTRSDVISSVHNFGNTGLTPFFLAFLSISVLGSLGLLYYYKEELGNGTQTDSLVSREFTFQLNNWLLLGATFVILMGTVFPAISEVLSGVRIVPDESFFNKAVVPLFLVIILLAGICTTITWRRPSIGAFVRRLIWPLATALVLVIVLVALGRREWYAIVAFAVCASVLIVVLRAWFQEMRARHKAVKENYLKAFWHLLRDNRPRYGGYIVHIAILLIAAGIIGSSAYAVETDASLEPGESIDIENYTLTYENFDHFETPSRLTVYATMSVANGGKLLGILTPEKFVQLNYDQAVTEVAIRSTPIEDLYVILVGLDEDGSVAFKILVNPMVMWMWVGGGLLAFGGVLAFWPGRQESLLLEQRTKTFRKETEIEEEIEERVQELAQQKGGLCPECKSRYSEGARFCPQCGAELGGEDGE